MMTEYITAAVKAAYARLAVHDQKQLLQDQFIKQLTDRKIPVSFARGRNIESVEQIAAVVAEAEKEFIDNTNKN